MAKNPELEDAVLVAIYRHLAEGNEKLREAAEGNDEIGREIIKEAVRQDVDMAHTIRFVLGSLVCYGYDFEKSNGEGMTVRELYLAKVKQTGQLSGLPGLETLLADGIKDNRFGWYLTE